MNSFPKEKTSIQSDDGSPLNGEIKLNVVELNRKKVLTNSKSARAVKNEQPTFHKPHNKRVNFNRSLSASPSSSDSYPKISVGVDIQLEKMYKKKNSVINIEASIFDQQTSRSSPKRLNRRAKSVQDLNKETKSDQLTSKSTKPSTLKRSTTAVDLNKSAKSEPNRAASLFEAVQMFIDDSLSQTDLFDYGLRECHLKLNDCFNGLGIHFYDSTNPKIKSVELDSPAKASGLRVNDRIVGVNSLNIMNMDSREIKKHIKEILTDLDEIRLIVINEDDTMRLRQNSKNRNHIFLFVSVLKINHNKVFLDFFFIYIATEIKRKMIENENNNNNETETKSFDGEKMVQVDDDNANELSPQSIMLSIQCDYLEEDNY